MKRILGLLFGMMLIASNSFATNLTITYTNEQPNTTILSSHWNQDMTDIQNFLNGNNLDSSSNIAVGGISTAALASLAVTNAKLSPIDGANKISGAAFYNLGNVAAGAGTIPVGNLPTGTGANQIITTTANYAFQCTGITTLPTAGATYSNNSVVYTVVSSTQIGGGAAGSYAAAVYATGSGNPQTSGTLTKQTGTGDATVTFGSWGGQFNQEDGSKLKNVVTSGAFGAWVDDSASYGSTLAATDGFVIATPAGSQTAFDISINTDSANPPTTVRVHLYANAAGNGTTYSGTCPVRKGDYWRVVVTSGNIGTVYWIPSGN